MEVAWVVSILATLVVGAFMGFKYRNLRDSITKLQEALKTKVEEKPKKDEQKSSLLDPYDVANRAAEEHEALMKKLNP